jgi:uncharacterized membrane protein
MKRFWALDRLRALAVVLMIQGHTFTALMQPRAFSPAVDRVHGLLHGLTAPAFLFGAGLAFGFATYGRYESHRQLGRATQRRFVRYLSLLAIGYALQLPGASLWAAFHVHGAQLELVCRIGPLQLVALTLGLCQLAIVVVPTPRLHAALSAALGLAVLAGADVVGRAGLSDRLPLVLGALFDDNHGSQFPLFPWASFALFGVALAGLLRERARPPHMASYMALGGLLVVAAFAALESGLAPFDNHWFWRTSPTYFAFRLGLVVIALGLLVRREDPTRSDEDGLTALLARRSLTAYVAHLLLLYGTPFTPNLVYRLGATLNLVQVSVTFALIFAATIAITLLLERLEQLQSAPRYRRAGVVLVGLTLLVR